MAEIAAGTVINERFEICEHVGSGGYASVYRGNDIQLSREVAIKRLTRTQAFDPQKRDEVIDEARKIASISHPNIVSVFDVLEFGDELLIVMEYLHGGSLHDYLRALSRQGEWVSILEAFSLLKNILQGLHAAHTSDQGPILHRDLKPLNILFNRKKQLKIVDFGLAAIGIVDEIQTAHPGKWEHAGTFGYKSPEQLKGAQLDPRSDLFNVGLIVYMLFAALHPFTDPRFLFNYKEMVLEPYRAIPSIHEIQFMPDLNEFLKKLLAEDPNDRFQSALEVLSELEHLEDNYNDSLLEHALELHDHLKGKVVTKIILTKMEMAKAIMLCKRNQFYLQGAFLYERSGFDFSDLESDFRDVLETDYNFCKRRSSQEV